MINIEVEGLNSIVNKFSKLPANLLIAIKEAITISVFLIEREAKMVTPVMTGMLRASIRPDYIRPMEAAISPHTDYAIIVHEGFGYGRNSRPRPFMFWGAKTALNDIEKTFEEKINQALNK
jgi:hypothetical protein